MRVEYATLMFVIVICGFQKSLNEEVTSFSANATGSRSVDLKWKYQYGKTVDEFILQFKGTVQTTSWVSQNPIKGQETKVSYFLSGLFPGDLYTFKVTAYTGNNHTEPAYTTAVTYPLHPDPLWNKANTTKSSITFHWEVNKSQSHAERFYLVLNNKGHYTPNHYYTFNNLLPSTRYTLQLYAETFNNTRSLTYGQVQARTAPENSFTMTEVKSETTENTITMTYSENKDAVDAYIFTLDKTVIVRNTTSVGGKVTFTNLHPGMLHVIRGQVESAGLKSLESAISVITNPRPPDLQCVYDKGSLKLDLIVSAPAQGNVVSNFKYILCWTTDGNPWNCGPEKSYGQNGKDLFSASTLQDLMITYNFKVTSVYENSRATANHRKQSVNKIVQCQYRPPPVPIAATDTQVTIKLTGDPTALYHSIFVSTTNTPQLSSLDQLYTWGEAQDKIAPYVAIYRCENMFSTGTNCAVKYRNKRQARKWSDISVIGDDATCVNSQKNKYCNGPLQPGTTYYFMLRAHYDGTQYKDSAFSEAITTEPAAGNSNTSLIIGIVVAGVVILIILVAVVIILRKRKKPSAAKNNMIATISSTTQHHTKPDQPYVRNPSVDSSEVYYHIDDIKLDSNGPQYAPLGRDRDTYLVPQTYQDLSTDLDKRESSKYVSIVSYT